MKWPLTLMISGLLIMASMSEAQTPNTSAPPGTQNRPDARYPNPSGQDSNPSSSPVKPTKTAPANAHPEDSQPATTGAASNNTYHDGKKPDDSAGCSTPTDAASAGVKVPDRRSTQERQGKQTVCTTSGGDDGGHSRKHAEKPERPKATSTDPQPPTPPK